MLIIEPLPDFSMCGITSRHIRYIDRRLTRIVRSQSSSVSSSTVARRIIPALLKRMSMRPNSRILRSTTRLQSAAELTSVRSKSARPPLVVIAAAVLFPASWLMSAMATAAPSRAKSRAVARPMPDPAPVISAVLFPRRISLLRAKLDKLPPRQPSGRLAAIQREHLAGRVGCVLGREIRKQRSNFLRLGMPPKRNFAVYLLQHLVGVLGALHGRQHVPGRDRAHPNLGSQL